LEEKQNCLYPGSHPLLVLFLFGKVADPPIDFIMATRADERYIAVVRFEARALSVLVPVAVRRNGRLIFPAGLAVCVLRGLRKFLATEHLGTLQVSTTLVSWPAVDVLAFVAISLQFS
jgi:hypothetical protein